MRISDRLRARKQRRDMRRLQKRGKLFAERAAEERGNVQKLVPENTNEAGERIEREAVHTPQKIVKLVPDDDNPVPPKTRFTDEYREFLEGQQASGKNTSNGGEES